MSKRALVALVAWAACQAAMAADAPKASTERAAAGPTGGGSEAAEEPEPARPSQLEVSTGDRSMDLLLKAKLGGDSGVEGDPAALDRASRGMSVAVPDPSRRASAPPGTLAADRDAADPTLVRQLIKSAVGVLGGGERAPPRESPTVNDRAEATAMPLVVAAPADGVLAVPGRFFAFIREHRDWVVSLAVLVGATAGFVTWRQGRASSRPAAPAGTRRHGSRRRRRT
ncbi:hypothetical protein [Ideonella sp. A 288]|uniref:hypothetical protein n=1 Tax=Ideonella sp. A 288 TaxID=1962181 RepID=UPI0011852B3B|nr:hypothetical protein [Ideonella sp. A 288]